MKKLLVLLLIIVGGMTVNAQKVSVGADPSVHLSKYKTYAWSKPFPPGNPFVQSQ